MSTFRRRFSTLRLAALSLTAVALTACTSPWRESFEPATVADYPPTDRAVIREVPWERIDSVLRELDAERVSSDVHPDEWPAERLEAHKARLATALQLSEDPADLEILGRSAFNSTADVDLFDGALSDFATSIGADYAIWSTSYVGRAQTIEREPVTRTGVGWTRNRSRDGHIDYDYLPYNETLYVPVVIERDQFAWVVYYVRVTGDDGSR